MVYYRCISIFFYYLNTIIYAIWVFYSLVLKIFIFGIHMNEFKKEKKIVAIGKKDNMALGLSSWLHGLGTLLWIYVKGNDLEEMCQHEFQRRGNT